MKRKDRSRFVKMSLLALTLLLLSCQIVFGQENPNNEEVNLLDVPKHLSEALGIPLYAGQLLACVAVSMVFLLPIAIFSRGNMILMLITGLVLLGSFIAIGWLEIWYILIIVLVVAGVWSAKIRGWLT